MPLTGQSFAIAVGYYTLCAAVSMIVFGICRRLPAVKQFYQPRCFYSDSKNKTPQMLPNWAGIIGWIPPVAFFDQVTIYEYSGIDGLVMIRMLYFGIRLFIVLSFLANAVLLPLYLTGGQVDVLDADPADTNSYSTLDKTSLANVKPGDNRLYGTVVIAWVITAVMFRMLWRNTQVLVALRILYLQTQDVGDQACTILVQDVPGIVDGTGAHRLLFGWLCCLSPHKRLHMARGVTSALSKAWAAVEAWFDWLGDIVSGSLFAVLHGYVVLNHAIHRCLCCPMSDEPFSISGRRWTVGHFKTPAVQTPQPPATPNTPTTRNSPFHRPFTPNVDGKNVDRRVAMDVRRNGDDPEVVVHDGDDQQLGGVRPWTAPAPDDANTMLLEYVSSASYGADEDDPRAKPPPPAVRALATSMFMRQPSRKIIRKASAGAGRLPPIPNEDEDGSIPNKALRGNSEKGGENYDHVPLEQAHEVTKGRTDLEATLGCMNNSMAFDQSQEQQGLQSSVAQTKGTPQTSSLRRIQLFTEMSAWARAVRLMEQDSMTPQQMVDHEFRGLFHDKFKCAYLVTDTRTVEPIMRKYRNLVTQLLDTFDIFASQVQRNGNHKLPHMKVNPRRWGDWAVAYCHGSSKRVRVNKIEFLLAYLGHMRHRVLEAQAAAADLHFAAAFVTMHDRQSQVLARNVLLHHDTSAWVVRAAPPLEDVIWSSLRLRQWERMWRKVLVYVLYVALAFTYVFPVNAVQLLLGTQTLKTWFESKPLLWSLYAAFVPTLALKIFVWTLPLMIALVLSLRGKVCHVEFDLSMLSTFYMFQVLVVLFGGLLGGAWLTQLQTLLDSPGRVWQQLGSSAAQTSVLSCNYVLVQGLVTTPLFFLRLPELLILSIRVSLSYAERAKERIWQTRNIAYGANVAWITFAMCLGIVYTPINPIIAPIALLWLLIATTLWKWDLVFVFKQTVSAGGRMWRHIFWQMIVALMSMQIVVAAIVALKRCYAGAIMMIAPFVATIIFALALEKRFAKSTGQLSLRGAADIDDVNSRRTTSATAEGSIATFHYPNASHPSSAGLRHRLHPAAQLPGHDSADGVGHSAAAHNTAVAQWTEVEQSQESSVNLDAQAPAVMEMQAMDCTRPHTAVGIPQHASGESLEHPPAQRCSTASGRLHNSSFTSATLAVEAPATLEAGVDAEQEEEKTNDAALQLAVRTTEELEAAYVNPVMRFDEEEYNAVVSEARYWLRHGTDPARDLQEMRKVMDCTAKLSRMRRAGRYFSPRTTVDGRRRSQRDLIMEIVEGQNRPTTV